MGAAHGAYRCFTDSEIADLPCGDQLAKGSECLLHGNSWINSMLVVEVDVIRAEVSQRTVYAEPHIFR